MSRLRMRLADWEMLRGVLGLIVLSHRISGIGGDDSTVFSRAVLL